jgi:hypothetical protein
MADRFRRKRLLRLILALALLIILCTLGYQRGYDAGYASAEPPPSSTARYQVVYPVGDLVTPVMTPPEEGSAPAAVDFDRLIDLIVATIEHESWMESGTGEGEIQPFPTNLSLVISQTQRVHGQVAELLEQLRRLNEEIQAKEVVPYLQSCAAYGKDASQAFRKLPAGAKGTAAADKLFDRSVENLAELWGGPAFNGERTAEDFPTWSNAQRIATWPRGEGQAYLAVEDDPAAGRVLYAGWHKGE